MKTLFRVLMVAVMALALGIFARANHGYVQIALPTIQMEMSFNFFILAWLFSLAVFYAILRVMFRIRAATRRKKNA